MRSLLRNFADAGGTVLLSSHLLSEVQIVADEFTTAPNGLLAQATTEDVARAALDARIVLTDLAPGSAGGLEGLFLTLTADESREGVAA